MYDWINESMHEWMNQSINQSINLSINIVLTVISNCLKSVGHVILACPFIRWSFIHWSLLMVCFYFTLQTDYANPVQRSITGALQLDGFIHSESTSPRCILRSLLRPTSAWIGPYLVEQHLVWSQEYLQSVVSNANGWSESGRCSNEV